VTMGIEHVANGQATFLHDIEDALWVPTGIDHDPFLGLLAADNIAVGLDDSHWDGMQDQV
jgi:hypothetical protein